MNESQQQVIENLKRKIQERKALLSNLSYVKAIETVADDIIPLIKDPLQPAVIPELS